MIRWFCLSAISLILLADTDPASAQGRRRLAINDLADVDDDFHFQGEYAGWVRAENRCLRKDGLQVIARGDGRFAAVRYSGGLPGSGWDRTTKTHFEGNREGPVLILRGRDGGSIVIQGGRATLFDAEGSPQGTIPRVARRSPTLGATPTRGAGWLFQGGDTRAFNRGRISAEGFLQAGTEFASLHKDFTLHIEFRLPYMPYARGQDRSNSGVYLQSRYEVQVLDSFGLEGEANQCGGLYRQRRPDVNVCLPPLVWQTYDIHFRSARFDADGHKVQNARITVLHNGVTIHDDVEITSKTGAGREESPELLPIKLQDHGNPVLYRNIWILDRPQIECRWVPQPCRRKGLKGLRAKNSRWAASF